MYIVFKGEKIPGIYLNFFMVEVINKIQSTDKTDYGQLLSENT